MGISERHSAERNEEIPEEEEGTVHDNGSASEETFLETDYWPNCAL